MANPRLQSLVDDGKLQDRDVIFTNSPSPLSRGIRLREVGFQFWKAGMSVPSHAFQIFHSEGFWWCDEMCSWDPDDSYKRTSILKYTLGYDDDNVVAIYRAPIYADQAKRVHSVKRAIATLYTCKGYNQRGIVNFILPFLKEKSVQAYCSEKVLNDLQEHGFKAPAKGKDGDGYHPLALMRLCAGSGFSRIL